ncbi:MAG: hypothetical protein GEV03_28855 [Streptosporangiales bacterium]|nr:hypothetical protein [Streptosporangiales bacterium]
MPTLTRDYTTMIARLSAEFGELPRHRVERCVADVCVCALHLGFEVTPSLVETLARERLYGAWMSRHLETPLPRQRPATR